MNDARSQPSDLDALLRGLPPEEADRLREVWTLAGDRDAVPAPAAADLDRAQHRLDAALDRSGPHPVRRADRRSVGRGLRRIDLRWPALAAAVVLAAAALWWTFVPVVRTAPVGERLVVILPDDSRVELNSGAAVRHARFFRGTRAVGLVGEAYFEVEPGDRPFVVETFNAEIRVLGTQFSVRAWPRSLEPATTVALAEGRVAFQPAGRPGQAVTMAPGETRRVVSGLPGVPASVSLDEALAWRRGDFIARDALLGDVLDDIERRFAVDIQSDVPGLRTHRMNIALRRPDDARAVLHDLAAALDLRYRATAAGYELYAP